MTDTNTAAPHNPLALPGQKIVSTGKTNAVKDTKAPAQPANASRDIEKPSPAIAPLDPKKVAEAKALKAKLDAAKKPLADKPKAARKPKPEAKKNSAKPKPEKKTNVSKKDSKPEAKKPVVKSTEKAPRATTKITPNLTPEKQAKIDELIRERAKFEKDSKEYAALSQKIRVLRNPEGVKESNGKRRETQNEWLRNKYATDSEFREKQVKAVRSWRKKNPDRVASYNSKRKKSPQFRGATKVRNTIIGGLSRPKTNCGPKRDAKAFTGLVGCTRETFQKHIESQFSKGMTWENKGEKWTVSFKAELSKFDLTKEEEMKKAAHYKNVIVVAYE